MYKPFVTTVDLQTFTLYKGGARHRATKVAPSPVLYSFFFSLFKCTSKRVLVASIISISLIEFSQVTIHSVASLGRNGSL